MALIEHDEFVRGRVDLLQTGQLYASASLGDLHRILRGLPRPLVDQARLSLAWMHDATTATSTSLQVIASMAAVEALLPQQPVTHCTECGQARFSATRRVRNLLDSYADKALRDSFRAEIYPLRSRLAHGSHHHSGAALDLVPKEDDHMSAYKARAAATASILNWLIDHDAAR